jgi:molecular chaperone GrpE (heat shock protein)
MPPKKAIVPGAALQSLDTNQETLSLREARSQKRKATDPTP